MTQRKKERIVSKEKIVSKVKVPSISLRRKTPLKNVQKARKTAKLLEEDFKQTDDREEQIKIKRKIILAANRADKKGKKRGITKQKKKEYEQVARVYRNTYQRMVLEEIYRKPEAPAILS